MTPLKILYASSAFYPSTATHTLSIMRMCQALSDFGHDVTLAGIQGEKPMSDEELLTYYGLSGGFDIRLFNYSRTRFLGLSHGKNLGNLCQQMQADLVYSRLCLLPLSRLPHSVPLIYEMHSPGPVGHSFLQRKMFEHTILKQKKKRIIVSTNMLKDYLLERYPNLDIVVARLSAEKPFDIDVIEQNNFCSRKIKNTSNDHSERFRVGYTGALDLIGLRGTEIICSLASKMPDIDFHVVGGSDEAVTHWQSQARSENIFFYGHQSPDQIPMYLGCFDVMLAPLQLRKIKSAPFGRNMSPLKLSQYFAFGCAIVASDLPSHRELITNNENGLLVDADNIDQWATAIRRIQGDSSLCKRLKDNAKETYNQGFSPHSRIETIFRDFD